ncbi:hypothetical protein C1I98_19080 [Spongiactinospora gelatinilytica]|uniref:Uncharacterized protein n=1 Tax=Spongiactinospora gelatinilytica TaxID=2666298 RepID=A0A2W2FZD1_9ACTN|nr:hypothetical protein [Spongiactinospora gelatinilytica]PZG42986.1 hypothetical protein C1I98_19080 [Spongiactinospora gelatinilytica]
MRKLVAVVPHAARHKIRDIRSARRRPATAAPDPAVVDLRAWTGRNVIPFPREGGPTPAA